MNISKDTGTISGVLAIIFAFILFFGDIYLTHLNPHKTTMELLIIYWKFYLPMIISLLISCLTYIYSQDE